jgi:2-succinyl-5-enolpyruvyl-6-hydroxy-3-cyclohexene-1-carboxylate synthase
LGGHIQRVVVFGHPTLSRPVHALLERSDVEVVVVADHGPDWPDPTGRAERVVWAIQTEPAHGQEGWLAAWQQAGKIAQHAIDDVLDSSMLTGLAVARHVWATRQDRQNLVVGSSNPIRDLDLVAAPSILDGPVFANRGLAGIDGTVSTATGVALASGWPTRVLLGDLAFLHDAGGLLIGPLEQRPDVQVVVVNDDGGGIFSLLEHGEPAYAENFERVFGTPHGADIASLCAAYGVGYARVDDVVELRRIMAAPLAGRSVVEIPVNRAQLRELHAHIRTAVASAIDSG